MAETQISPSGSTPPKTSSISELTEIIAGNNPRDTPSNTPTGPIPRGMPRQGVVGARADSFSPSGSPTLPRSETAVLGDSPAREAAIVEGSDGDDQDYTKKDARTLREASPFQNHILLRGIFDEAQQRIGEDILGIAYDD